MAEPIVFTPPPRDRRQELIGELERAPQDHVEALLDLYSILQLLRDKGVLEAAKGGLGSGEKILGIITETLEADEVIRAIRNLVIFLKVLGSIEPDALEKIIRSTAIAIDVSKVAPPPGVFAVLRTLFNPSARRAAVPLLTSIQTAGEYLERSKVETPERPKTTRHSA